MKTEYDFDELLKGTIDSVSVKLKDFDADQLADLRKREAAGQKRAGMLAAIDRQTEALKDAETAKDAEPEKEGAVQADPAALADDPLAKLREGLEARGYGATVAEGDDRDPVDVVFEALDDAIRLVETVRSENDQTIADLTAKVNAAQQKQAAAAKKSAGGKELSIDGKVKPFAPRELRGNLRVQFVDEEDRTIASLPPLDFARSQFDARGDRAVLTSDVQFDPGAPMAQVMGAFLTVEGKPVAKASLVQPFNVGGGRAAKLPKGTLSFSNSAS